MKLYCLQCKQFPSVDSMLFGQVRLAFFRALSKYFSGKDDSAPLGIMVLSELVSFTSHSTHDRLFQRRVFPGNCLHWCKQTKTKHKNKPNIVTLFIINRCKKTQKTQKTLVSKSTIKNGGDKGLATIG